MFYTVHGSSVHWYTLVIRTKIKGSKAEQARLCFQAICPLSFCIYLTKTHAFGQHLLLLSENYATWHWKRCIFSIRCFLNLRSPAAGLPKFLTVLILWSRDTVTAGWPHGGNRKLQIRATAGWAYIIGLRDPGFIDFYVQADRVQRVSKRRFAWERHGSNIC